jgi:peptide deformylase
MNILTDLELLRTPSVPVEPGEVNEIREALEKALAESAELGRPGIGLAAPQIGIFKRMFIIRISEPNGKTFNLDVANARIEKGYDLKIFPEEGCLSFPDTTVKTRRYNEIYVVDNIIGNASFIATGLLAVAIQHEQDHVDGILMTDRLVK